MKEELQSIQDILLAGGDVATLRLVSDQQKLKQESKRRLSRGF